MFSEVGMPHGFCFLWNPGLLWLHIVSDLVIALAYFLIPLALLRIFRRRRDIAYSSVFLCFGAFIFACGITHVMEVVTLWHSVYWISGVLKAITGIISVLTLVVIVRITPGLLALPTKLADRRFEELIDHAPDAILQVDEQGKIIIANKTAETMFGFSHVELLGSNLDRLIPARNQGVHAETQLHFAQAGATRSMAEGMGDFHALRKDGAEIAVEIALSPIQTEAGSRTTAVIRDVSERVRIARELESERALKGQRLEVLARFSASIAHEMKNPLAIIHGRASDLAELAVEGHVSQADITKSCESILKTSDRALRILRGLAAIARDGTNDPMEKASVKEIITQAIELVHSRYKTHGIKLTTTLPPTLPPIDCRETQIGQVLVNLLNNAFDAVESSTQSERWVRVEASMDPETSAPPHHIRIDVLDGGPPLTPNVREHLMETFYTTKPLGGGIGIGLSVSKAIADGHNGTLVFLEAEGHTCFRLSLPIHTPDPAEVTA